MDKRRRVAQSFGGDVELDVKGQLGRLAPAAAFCVTLHYAD
jgi:hypothetical protein